VLAVGLHAALILGTGWLDRYRDVRPAAEQVTPVEVVDEIPQQKPDPPAAQPQPEKAEAAPEPSPPPTPASAPPLPPPAAPAAPAPETPAAPTAAPQPVEVEVSHGQVAAEPTAKPSEDAKSDKEGTETASEQAEAPSKDPPYPSEADAATAEHRFVPPSFRGAALPGASAQSQDSYKNLVFGMLERAKRLPPRTPGRHGAMPAYVRFMLDRSGNLVSVSMLGTTGDAELDAEALALVRRAAPFPKPPPEGTLLVFTPVIYFVYDE
jgi:TonB family protein